MPESSKPSVSINLPALQGHLAIKLEQLLDMLRVSMAGLNEVTEAYAAAAVPFFSMQSEPRRRQSHKDIVANARAWLIRTAFRDAIEYLSSFLEGARQICAVTAKGESGLTGADFKSVVGPEADAFDGLPFPAKLKFLANVYGITTKMDEQTLSANRVRNCLVHRYGIVGKKDVGRGDELALEWRAVEIVTMNKDGSRTVMTAPGAAPENTAIGVRMAARRKQFEKGKRVELTYQEIHEVFLSLHLYSTEVVKAVASHMQNAGFKIRPTV